MSDEPTSPAAAPDNRDLYCLQCGYNLRGLAGDPRRCPECGHLNPLSELLTPAKLIRAQLRSMEATLTGCVLALLACVGFAIVGIDSLATDSSSSARDRLGLLGALGIFGLAWWLGMWRFRNSCGGARGWRRAFGNYHWRLALFISVIVGLLPVSVFLSRVLPVNLMAFALLLLWVGVLLGGMEWVTRRARKDLQPLALNAWLRKQEQCRQSETFAGGER